MASINSASSRHNKRDWRTPISADELAGDPTMVGHTSLLQNVPVTTDLDRSSLPKAEAPETGPPALGTPVRSLDAEARQVPIMSPPVSDPSEACGPVTDGSDTEWSGTGGLKTGPPVLSRAPIIREARLVQEGHTNGEQRVYDAMWKSARVVDDQRRVLTIGFGKIAQISNLSESNCKPAIAGLLEKLAIERLPDRGPNLALGRTYQIYSWSMVLKRRREAGLTHVIKTRGVVFVNPTTGERLTNSQTPPRSNMSRVETGPLVSSRNAELDSEISSLEEFTQQFPTHMQHDQDVRRLAELKQRREEELRAGYRSA